MWFSRFLVIYYIQDRSILPLPTKGNNFVMTGSLLQHTNWHAGLWDLSSPIRDGTHVPGIKRQILNQWMTGKSSDSCDLAWIWNDRTYLSKYEYYLLKPKHLCKRLRPLKRYSLSHVWLFVTPWTVACQAPLSTGFSSQEYCSGLLFPSLGDLPDLGIKPRSPSLHADSLL